MPSWKREGVLVTHFSLPLAMITTLILHLYWTGCFTKLPGQDPSPKERIASKSERGVIDQWTSKVQRGIYNTALNGPRMRSLAFKVTGSASNWAPAITTPEQHRVVQPVYQDASIGYPWIGKQVADFPWDMVCLAGCYSTRPPGVCSVGKV